MSCYRARAIPVSLLFHLALVTSAWAQGADDFLDLNKAVFTKANQRILCEPQGGISVVSRNELAALLIGKAGGVSQKLLRRANAEGLDDGPVTDDKRVYFVASPRPFGANVAYTGEMSEAAREQFKLRLALQSWLLAANSKDYQVVPAGLPPPDPQRYFQKQSEYEIQCKGRPRDAGGAPGGSSPGGSGARADGGPGRAEGDTNEGAAWFKGVVVRKSVADIAVPSGQLKKANSALVSINRDIAADRKTASVEGLVGFILAGSGADRAEELRQPRGEPRALSWWNIAPYVYTKKIDETPNSKTRKDIDYVTPGVTANWTWVNAPGNFSFDLQLDGSVTVDHQQNSQVHAAGVRFAPSFLLDDLVIFGAPIPVLGFFAVRPDVAFVAREFVIDDPGLNPDLKKQSSYASVGFDAGTQVFLTLPESFLANVVFKVAYIYRDNSGGLPDIRRFTAGLTYTPPSNNNITFDLDYSNGRDVTTLQDEKRWLASLGFRY